MVHPRAFVRSCVRASVRSRARACVRLCDRAIVRSCVRPGMRTCACVRAYMCICVCMYGHMLGPRVVCPHPRTRARAHTRAHARARSRTHVLICAGLGPANRSASENPERRRTHAIGEQLPAQSEAGSDQNEPLAAPVGAHRAGHFCSRPGRTLSVPRHDPGRIPGDDLTDRSGPLRCRNTAREQRDLTRDEMLTQDKIQTSKMRSGQGLIIPGP